MANVREYPVEVLELMKVGRVWVLESLPDGHLRTGRAIREHLEDMFAAKQMDIPVTFRAISTTAELLAALDELLGVCQKSARGVILDIETHGLDDFSGLQLRDGSNVAWDELKPKFQAINMATRFNLFLVMACCNGGYFGQMARLEEVSAICGYLGPTSNVGGGALLDGLKTFFTTLFSGLDATDALTAVRQQWPQFPYFYSTAMGLFRWGAEGYMRDQTTTKRLRERARARVERLKAEYRVNVPSVNELVRRLQALEKPYMERAIRTYFALNEFPDNTKRYPISYGELFSAAHRRL